jgi:exosortase B
MTVSTLASPESSPLVRVRADAALSIWLPVVAGSIFLYLPAYRDVASALTPNETGTQPICLLIWAWMLWSMRDLFTRFSPEGRRSVTGWSCIAAAMLLYTLGRSQEFLQLEIGSQIFLFAGVVLLLLEPGSLRKLWFPALFLFFLVPVPGSLMNAVLVPLKNAVSFIVSIVLYRLGFPIARDGVVLFIGHYQLLIADACSGLNSMVALSAIGFMYVYLAGHRRTLSNALLLLAVLPIAFLANIVRVCALVLTTYFEGDDAGQRFHDYAAFIEIAVVFGAFILLDRIIRAAFGRPGVGAPRLS